MIPVLAFVATTAVEAPTAMNDLLGVGATLLLGLSTVVETGEVDDPDTEKMDVISSKDSVKLIAFNSNTIKME